MGEVNGLVTQTALAIRDEDELEVAASILDAALRRAKAEVLREVKYEALGSRIKCFKSDTLYAEGNDDALNALVKWIDARAAQIEEGE